jgi:hypothetical protein
MTGKVVHDTSEGIWDDGEWISWDYINQHLYEQELKREFPESRPELVMVFQDLLDVAAQYKGLTGRYLQIWGELGELYAEIKFGVKRHRPMAQGSDGKLGDDFVEVKTISPEKGVDRVQVKRAGNFNKLLVVKISEEFEFTARLIDRKALRKGDGKHAKYVWQD